MRRSLFQTPNVQMPVGLSGIISTWPGRDSQRHSPHANEPVNLTGHGMDLENHGSWPVVNISEETRDISTQRFYVRSNKEMIVPIWSNVLEHREEYFRDISKRDEEDLYCLRQMSPINNKIIKSKGQFRRSSK